MRLSLPAYVAALFFLATAACSDQANSPDGPSAAQEPTPTKSGTTTSIEVDLSGLRQGEIPAAYPESDLSDLAPDPGNFASFHDQLEWEAMEETAEFAGIADPDASSRCPSFDSSGSEEFTCMVEFFDEEYEYAVSIEYDADYEDQVYTTDLASGPIMRDIVETRLRYELETEYLMCDMSEIYRLELTPDWEDTRKTGINCSAYNPATDRIVRFELEIGSGGEPIILPSVLGFE
ncbi:hypothetical protein ACFQS3_09900 [Glycomyces mayteni]|uniref:DUF4333 domain-containing protein n=1 Tax=Glycomyces mayteni TaxID=543887 RepID=A0ABW2D5U2_9ACTN|nr:hypothetical protein GCM10025732_29640 [Glycomyces mayteni]